MRSRPLLALATLAVALVAAPTAAMATAPETASAPTPVAAGTVAFDYRNRPDVTKLIGYETVVLSPLAVEAAAALRTRGSHVLVWLQPFLCPWRGRPPAPGTLLGDAYALAESRDAWLRDTTAAVAVIQGFDLPACRVYDFRDTAFVTDLATMVATRLEACDGVLLDYGCPSLSWESSLAGVDARIWEEWSAGHLRYMETLQRRRPAWRLLCQCQRWGSELASRCDGLVHEKVGWSLNPYAQVLEEAARAPDKRSILMIVDRVGREDGPRRRATAALALLLDYGFSYRREDALGQHPSRNPEHFELDLGSWDEASRQVRAGVYLREAEYGFTLLNLSATVYRFEGASVPPGDALTAQTRDPATGKAMPWRTAMTP